VGNRAKLYGLNLVGLKRRNFPSKTISALKAAYKIIFTSNLKLKAAIKKIEDEIPDPAEVKLFTDFLRDSKRGFCR
jgi:UDP-N-acetylglucosamine acyltransferase